MDQQGARENEQVPPCVRLAPFCLCWMMLSDDAMILGLSGVLLHRVSIGRSFGGEKRRREAQSVAKERAALQRAFSERLESVSQSNGKLQRALDGEENQFVYFSSFPLACASPA